MVILHLFLYVINMYQEVIFINDLKEKKFYTCRYDTTFKEVFMKEDNKDILIALLESILDIKIKELTYLNLEKNNGNIFVKRKHFDLHIKTETENIQIEVNNHLKDYTRNRNASYIFDTYTYEVLRGEDYLGKTRVIQINLTLSSIYIYLFLFHL